MGTRYKYKRFRHPNQIRLVKLLGRNDPLVDPNDRKIIHVRIMYRNLPVPERPNGYEIETKWSEALRSGTDGNTEAPRIVKRKEESDDVPYEAVSWTWGPDKNGKTIRIRGGGGWKTLVVRKNLIKVLDQLRLEDSARILWVDGVSIDQSSDESNVEKNQQVAMMAHIYGNATNVCICLGEHYDRSELAFGFISRTVSDLGAFREITTGSVFEEEWKALAALMTRPWFGRRWVVQEISHATAATIHCGSSVVGWTDFEMAVALFERDAHRIAKIFQGSKKADYDPDFFGDVQAMGATRLVKAKSKLFLRDDSNKIIEYKYNLCDLVKELSTFAAETPHDMVYAVLSLAKDTYQKTRATDPSNSNLTESSPSKKKRKFSDAQSTSSPNQENPPNDKRSKKAKIGTTSSSNEHELVNYTAHEKRLLKQVIDRAQSKVEASKTRHQVFSVNYKQDFFEVCKQFLDFAFRHSRETSNLDILCRPWAPRSSKPLPSWIPSVEDASFETRPARFAPGGQQIARKHHDPLVQGSDAGITVYNACRNQRSLEWRFGDEQKGESKFSLFVSGFVVDTIGAISVFAQLGNVPEEWFALAGWYPWDTHGRRIPSSKPPDQLWRTLVADR